MAKQPKKAAAQADKVEPRIAEATGAAASAKDGDLAKRIETAMSDAVTEAAAKGITDPNQIRQRMLEARDAVKGL